MSAPGLFSHELEVQKLTICSTNGYLHSYHLNYVVSLSSVTNYLVWTNSLDGNISSSSQILDAMLHVGRGEVHWIGNGQLKIGCASFASCRLRCMQVLQLSSDAQRPVFMLPV